MRITYGHRGDVGKVSGDTGGVHDIVQGQLINQRACLQQQREGLFLMVSFDPERRRRYSRAHLANTTRGTENN